MTATARLANTSTIPCEPVAAYNEAERDALDRLPNRIIEASRTVVYDHLGYPGRVTAMRQLWKYADAMQEQRTRVNYDILGGLTDQEFDLIDLLTHKVRALTRERCDREVTPASSLLRAVIAFRAIQALEPRPKTILEFGPGSGYLGALLIHALNGNPRDGREEYAYYAVENCQAFYLWQQLLWGGDNHLVSWWDWMSGNFKRHNADLYVANHVLNEMHPTALRFAVNRAPDLFLVENFGGQVTSTDQNTRAVLRAAGYHETLWQSCALMHKGRAPGIQPQDKLTKTWDDLLELWGGEVPKTGDELFWEAC